MERRFDTYKRTLLLLAVIVAFVAVVVPSCRMVGCSMDMGGSMSMTMGGHLMGMPVIHGVCGGETLVSSAPDAIVPSGADSLTLASVAAVLAALAFFVPRVATSGAFVVPTASPPPPIPVRGERSRL